MHSYYHGALKYNFQRFIVEEGKTPRVAYRLAKPLATQYARRHGELIGKCDCCGKGPRELTKLVAYGIDTAACEDCRNVPKRT